MSRYIFLYREKDSDDRDCCAYIEPQPRWECDHYFGSVTLHGACYCGHDFPKYEDVETVLNKKEYNALVKYDKDLHKLGYGIKRGDERYEKGMALAEKMRPIFDKLESDKAKEFQQKIIDSEIEWMKDEYNLSDEDIEKIFDEYYLDYRDRGIIGYVWDDIDEAAEEEAWQLGYVSLKGNEPKDRYFDYEKFGEDLLENESYLELDDGRIVRLNY